NYRQLKKSEIESLGKLFWNTCKSAKNVDELTRFIEGLLLPSEKIMVARRIKIAKEIIAKKPQTKIQVEMHVGQSTVDSVEEWLAKSGPEVERILSK
ncbi:MAG: hypothetical protein KAS32_26505, partial [Candidatus Peribacteraceae bacterium]|nr:hypothetical protein [Candidatus Peribacteraceae bacterium]